jgi:general L-amino acid transport system permease protein
MPHTAGGWLRRNLFSSPGNTALTVLALGGLAAVGLPFLQWALLAASFAGAGHADCAPDGACWLFIRARLPLLVYGHFPPGETWRVNAAALLLAAFCVPVLRLDTRRRGLWLAALLLLFAVLAGVLLLGGVAGLAPVDPDAWGGLMLNVILAFLVTGFSLPLGIGLALGRQSRLPVVRTMSAAFIETWRGLPLLGVLFVSAVMAPLFLPNGVSAGRLARAVAALSLFYSAYMAEVVRGGLQSIAAGQDEAAYSLGLRTPQVIRLVTLPQALRQSIPGLMNTVIDLFKDTTLVSIIGVFDLLGTISQSLRDPAWPGMAREGFTFASLVFFVACFSLSLYSRLVERRLPRR